MQLSGARADQAWGNRNRLQSITGFLVIVIAIAILVLKCHVIAIAIEYIAKVRNRNQ